MAKIVVQRSILVFILGLLWVYLRSVYRDRLGAFGCFDDCFNIAGGYFIGLGKRLYTDFFFNHQPILAYISWAIQTIYQPQSIYELILRHRMALIYFFAVSDVLLTLRFGFAGFAFAFLYETTKGYVFGERFLAEAMIVYPLVYLFGLSLRGSPATGGRRSNLTKIEPVIAAIATWFVVFSREPYVPLALFLFCVFLWRRKNRLLPIMVFGALSIAAIGYHNPADYWWNVVVASARSVAGAEIQQYNLAGIGLVSIFLYPVQVFLGGAWNHFRLIEAALSLLLFMIVVMRLYRHRVDKQNAAARTASTLMIVVITLGLANIRQVAPGTVYYGAFHHMVWYAMVIAAVTYVIPASPAVIHAKAGTQHFLGWFAFFGIVGYAILSPTSYLHEKVDRTAEFQIGYSHYITHGEIIRRLSQSAQTMFVEEWDELIYWQARRPVAFRYTWWSSTLAGDPTYRDAKAAMWRDSPPDFYVGLCKGEDGLVTSLPEAVAPRYLRLTQNGKPACLFVKKQTAKTISVDQWQSVRDFGIDTPEVI